jgi:hypothetical protein
MNQLGGVQGPCLLHHRTLGKADTTRTHYLAGKVETFKRWRFSIQLAIRAIHRQSIAVAQTAE